MKIEVRHWPKRPPPRAIRFSLQKHQKDFPPEFLPCLKELVKGLPGVPRQAALWLCFAATQSNDPLFHTPRKNPVRNDVARASRTLALFRQAARACQHRFEKFFEKEACQALERAEQQRKALQRDGLKPPEPERPSDKQPYFKALVRQRFLPSLSRMDREGYRKLEAALDALADLEKYKPVMTAEEFERDSRTTFREEWLTNRSATAWGLTYLLTHYTQPRLRKPEAYHRVCKFENDCLAANVTLEAVRGQVRRFEQGPHHAELEALFNKNLPR